MLSLIAWTVTRLDPSTVALVALTLESTFDGATSIPWSIVSGALAAVAGAGVVIGVFKASVNTLTKTVDTLNLAVTAEKAARNLECDKLDGALNAAIAAVKDARSRDLEKWNATEMTTRERLTRIETRLDLKTTAPRQRDHESTAPRRR